MKNLISTDMNVICGGNACICNTKYHYPNDPFKHRFNLPDSWECFERCKEYVCARTDDPEKGWCGEHSFISSEGNEWSVHESGQCPTKNDISASKIK